MKEIILLVDYKGFFGSKNNAKPYRSGLRLDRLRELFESNGYHIKIISFSEVDFNENWENRLVLYTSQEDINAYYKDYIEDIVFGLEQAGARLIPDFRFLRSHNNKIMMEILRNLTHNDDINRITSRYFGALKEALDVKDELTYPCVLKRADGAMSSNVAIIKNQSELAPKIRKLCETKDFLLDLKDYGRPYLHQGYTKESRYRKKFVIQKFIPGLNRDWKVLVFNKKYFIVERGMKKGDFRASGSGLFACGSEASFPEGIFEYAQKIYDTLNVPCLSIDIGFADNKFYLFEFQALYFGSKGHWMSDCYFQLDDSTLKYKPVFEKLDIEEVFVYAIVQYLSSKTG